MESVGRKRGKLTKSVHIYNTEYVRGDTVVSTGVETKTRKGTKGIIYDFEERCNTKPILIVWAGQQKEALSAISFKKT